MARKLTVEAAVTLEQLSCGQCGLVFAVDEDWACARRRDHVTWYCPNGHPRHWPGESDVERAQREAREAIAALMREQARRVAAQDQARAAAEHARAAERSASAWKGHATRARRKAVHGVCPAPGCGRTFQNLQRHVKGQHPDWASEHGELKADV
jgi:hypothetical protein